uniref:N-acetyltransferase domain-containing protein n=1 Tax=Bursaphelenchus xylophilus TaxID=6326 RepID=A0A1I7RK02_BURXY
MSHSPNFLREFHFWYEITIFIISWVLGWMVLLLIMFKTPRSFRGYSHMIALNTVVDLIYSLTDLITMETVDLHGGILYMFPANPYFPTNIISARWASSFWIFALYMTIMALPMQFMYRYGLLCRDKPFTAKHLAGTFGSSLVYLAIHCYIFKFTFKSPSPFYTKILAENPIYTNDMPSDYIAGDARELNAMFVHFADCNLIIIVCYGAVFWFGYQISQTLKRTMGSLSKQTAAAQKHITRIMALQALYPLISLVIPTGAIALYPLIASPRQMIQLGFFGCISMNLIPILNPLSVLLVIPIEKNLSNFHTPSNLFLSNITLSIFHGADFLSQNDFFQQAMVQIRQALPNLEDAGYIMGLVRELAEFEKMPDHVKIDEKTMAADLERDAVRVKLAFVNGKIAGMALYFYIYSSWEGQSIHMEDLYIKNEFRRQGLARLLVKELAKEASEKKMPRINWTVLDWNTNARNFYHKIGAVNLTEKEGWLGYRLTSDGIKALATES